MTKRIAVIAPSRHHFGNVLTQLPFLVGLKEYYGDCEITVWSTVETSKHLLNPLTIKDVVNFKGWSSLKFIQAFNQHNYDMVYNLRSGSGRLHVLIGLFGNAKKKYGISNHKGYRFLYDTFEHIERGRQYIGKAYLRLLESVSGVTYSTDIIKILSPQTSSSLNANALVILPGGGAGDYKRWPIEKFISSCEDIASTTPSRIEQIIFILGPDEQHYKEVIPQQIGTLDVEVLDSPSLEMLILAASKTQLAIANDCGPAHIFQMMRVPMISLWASKCQEKQPFNTLSEWFQSHEHAWALIPCDNDKTIKSISCEKVSTLAKAQLSRFQGNV